MPRTPKSPMHPHVDDAVLAEFVAGLSLETQVRLTGGQTFWTTAPIPVPRVAELPVGESPVGEGPVAELPVAEGSVAEVPVGEGPAADVPVTEAPISEVPISEVSEAELPGVVMSDGPHGLRKQDPRSGDNLGLSGSVPATCFPPLVALAQTWAPETARAVGEAIGQEALAQEVDVVLGPGVNLKRDPRGGRNFEYFSEDPILTGHLAAAWITGLQSTGVGACLKHFVANDAETERGAMSSEVSARALREVYFRPFVRAIRTARPAAIMCSYNRLNGERVAESRSLLTDLLRTEWGFTGAVISDWGAITNHPAALAAGADLAMPGPRLYDDAAIIQAVRTGQLSAQSLRESAARVIRLGLGRPDQERLNQGRLDQERPGPGRPSNTPATAKLAAGCGGESAPPQPATVSASAAKPALPAKPESQAALYRKHHELAREVAAQAIVLLRNENAALPLDPTQSLAVIGEFARQPRYQGGGSSHVNATQVDIPLTEIRRRWAGPVTFAPGYVIPQAADTSLPAGAEEAALAVAPESACAVVRDAALAVERESALAVAQAASAAVVFLGLPENAESEGFDRTHIELPAAQLELARAVAQVQPRTVAVVMHGTVVRLAPIAQVVPAILDAGLPGQGGGAALAGILCGDINPSGKLAETVPARLEDTPGYLDFPGAFGHHQYAEGVFTGHRWYDARRIPVTYPFGHGLSYTHFDYSDLQVRFLPGEPLSAGGELDNAAAGTAQRARAQAGELRRNLPGEPESGGVAEKRESARAGGFSAGMAMEVSVEVQNTGARAGREVVQFYVQPPRRVAPRPVRELKGFAAVTLQPGEAARVSARIPWEELAYWDPQVKAWFVEPGEHIVYAAASSQDLRCELGVDFGGHNAPLRITRETPISRLLADPVAAGPMRRAMIDAGLAPAAPAEFSASENVQVLASSTIGMLRALGTSPEILAELFASLAAAGLEVCE
ncbi:glycoside hydrolase family 3 C-terminal domain-containing protein [Actinobaculum suis]|uniref:glycoside hydrolase family 3 C-terminal domain-containing protein n=1 Tax=Actinobaculum suis TaxID=1657 RepID=UPI000ACED422|nr:glycoside hydrolase family 3 C-terminal domain-containing protein [Actinobaculum suis]